MEQDIYYKGYKIKIREDDNPDSPNDWEDNELFLVYSHRQFTVRRKGFDPENIFYNPEHFSEYYILPVEAYIHSGVLLSLFTGEKYCKWDSSVTGYILPSKTNFKSMEDASRAAESLIQLWNDYLLGNIYGFIIEKPVTTYSISKEKFETLKFENDLANLEGEFDIYDEWLQMDSCWGFYGNPETSGCIDEAKATIDNY